jgi:hypothetical protein
MSWYTASNSTNQMAEQLIYGEWLYYKYIYIYTYIHTLQVWSYLQFSCNTILDVTGCEYNYISDIYSYKCSRVFRIIINVQWCKVILEQIRFKYSNASIHSEVQFICKIIPNSARSLIDLIYKERFLVGGSSGFRDDIFQSVWWGWSGCSTSGEDSWRHLGI